MKEYMVTVIVTISVHTKVKAKSKKEAIEIADDRPLCDIDTSDYYAEDEFWVTSGELDGLPENIKVEE